MNPTSLLVPIWSLIQNYVGMLVGFIKNLRNRKTIIIALLICFFIMYYLSSYLLPAHRHFHQSQIQADRRTESCLDPFFEEWGNLIASNKAILKEVPGSATENEFFPFTGNGNIGYSADKDGKFYIIADKESILLPFAPILKAHVVEENAKEKKAILLNLKDGVVHIVSSFLVNKQCVIIEEKILTHRQHYQLLSHEIIIKNMGSLPVTITFDMDVNDKKNVMTTHKTDTKQDESQHSIVYSKLSSSSKFYESVYICAAIADYQQSVHVPQKSKNKIMVNSIIKYKIIPKEKTSSKVKRTKKSISLEDKKIEDELALEATKELLDVVKMKNEVIFKQHTDSWDESWKVGSDVGSDNDPDTATPLHVKLIHYYMYTSMIYNLTYKDNTKEECSSEAPTCHSAELWVIPTSVKSFYTMKEKWINFLVLSNCIEKDGLIHYLSIREYMTLAFMGLQYKRQHLQLALNPSNLRSNLSVYNIPLERFDSKAAVTIKLLYDNHDSYSLEVICTGPDNPAIYGCSVACEYVAQLTTSLGKYSVHNTNPVTPIFYISTNRTHLQEIGDQPFMKRAKANGMTSQQHDMEVHHFKLSPKFWLAVIVLVVSFHVIIIKMIYNECRKDRTGVRRRGPYNS